MIPIQAGHFLHSFTPQDTGQTGKYIEERQKENEGERHIDKKKEKESEWEKGKWELFW